MMSSYSWLFAPKSKWDNRFSLAHLVRMVPPTEMALILAMTDGFPEKVKRKMVDMMIRHYLARVRNAMKSKVFSRIKVLKIMSLSIFMTYDTDNSSPLLDDLKFRWLFHNHVKPIQLEHMNLPSFPFLFRIKYKLFSISMKSMHASSYYNLELMLYKYGGESIMDRRELTNIFGYRSPLLDSLRKDAQQSMDLHASSYYKRDLMLYKYTRESIMDRQIRERTTILGYRSPLLYTLRIHQQKSIKDNEEPIKDDEEPIYDYKELLRLVKPKMVVTEKKKTDYLQEL